MMINVLLKDILRDRSYPEGGTVLYVIAEEAMENRSKILLDMIGVDSVPTTFMNTSFGDLMSKYGVEKTKNLFVFNNITKSQLDRIRKYFDDFQKLIEKMQNK